MLRTSLTIQTLWVGMFVLGCTANGQRAHEAYAQAFAELRAKFRANTWDATLFQCEQQSANPQEFTDNTTETKVLAFRALRSEPEYSETLFLKGYSFRIRNCGLDDATPYSLELSMDYFTTATPSVRVLIQGDYQGCLLDASAVVAPTAESAEWESLDFAELCGEPLSLAEFQALQFPFYETLASTYE